jgi:hypothetical protein
LILYEYKTPKELTLNNPGFQPRENVKDEYRPRGEFQENAAVFSDGKAQKMISDL